jgi:hypothetical protein
MGDLSEHFSKREFVCKCCGHLVISGRLVLALEHLRELAGLPIKVHGGYRCTWHNEQAGGVTGSEHTRGTAADIEIPGLSLQRMYEYALEVPEFAGGGIGVYDGNFLHVDVRGHTARWARVRGQYVGIQHLVREPVMMARSASPAPSG